MHFKYFFLKNFFFIVNPIFNGSTILTNDLDIKLAHLINLPAAKTYELVYKASVDGMNASSFHSKCDGILGTLTLIKSKNLNIFGGYTEADWSGFGYKYDANAFLFSLINKYSIPTKMSVMIPDYAILSSSSIGPAFGSGHDLACFDNSGLCQSQNLRYTYQLPEFLTETNGTPQTFLGGVENFLGVVESFQVLDVEVYSVLIDRKLFLIFSSKPLNNLNINIIKFF